MRPSRSNSGRWPRSTWTERARGSGSRKALPAGEHPGRGRHGKRPAPAVHDRGGHMDARRGNRPAPVAVPDPRGCQFQGGNLRAGRDLAQDRAGRPGRGISWVRRPRGRRAGDRRAEKPPGRPGRQPVPARRLLCPGPRAGPVREVPAGDPLSEGIRLLFGSRRGCRREHLSAGQRPEEGVSRWRKTRRKPLR